MGPAVDLYTASRGFLPGRDLFCFDGFHPSSAGYEKWAEVMWPTVETAVRYGASRLAS